MSYELAYLIAVAAAAVGLIAALVGAWSLREALRDRAWIRREQIGNGRRIAAYRAVRAERARFAAILMIVVGLGVLLFGQPAPSSPSRPDVVSVGAGVALASILLAMVVLAVDAVAGVISRRHLDLELAKHHDATAPPRSQSRGD